MFSTPAKNLFQQAILQSNAGFGLPEETDGNGHVKSSILNEQDRGLALAKSLSKNNIPLTLKELRQIPSFDILTEYHEIFPNHYQL